MVTSTGTVSGTASNGIYAKNNSNSTGSLIINVANVTGGTNGIFARNYGTGVSDLTITSTGIVNGLSSENNGIYAVNKGRNLTVNVSYVSGGSSGIVASNNASGFLSITSTDTVKGINANGISAYNSGTDLTITAKNVSGAYSGIRASNQGSGALTITTTGNVSGTGRYGIFASNNGGQPSTINVGSLSVVKGGYSGITAYSASNQSATINIAGQVGNLSGLSTDLAIMAIGTPTTVNLLSGSTTTGLISLGNANTNPDPPPVGNSTVNWTGGTLAGSIEMVGSNNTINITGVPAANMTQVSHLQGDPTYSGQVLTLNDIQYRGGTFGVNKANPLGISASDDLANGINLLNWDTINFTDGSQWTLTSGLTLKDATVNIDATSTLYAGNGVMPVISAPTTPVTVNNAGTIDLTNGSSTGSNMLTIIGYYVGDNGILKVDTVLGPGASHSDELIIDGSHGGGSATGTTRIFVNLLGTPNATTGDGIQIVNAINGATIASGAFTLARPLVDGAYSYGVFQGGPNAIDAYGDSSTYDYYIRSTNKLSSASQVYAAYPSTLLALDAETLGTMQERTGNRVWGQEIDGTGAWIRVGGSASAYNPVIGTDYTQDNGFVQGGYDRTISGSQAGKFTLGGFGTYSYGNSKMQLGIDPGTLTTQTGSIQTSGYGLGANLTWLGKNGLYADGVIQGTWYTSTLSSSALSQNVTDNHGFGDAVSIEGGQRIALNKTWAVVPQAQLIYSAVSFDGITDSNGVSATLQDGTSLLGRIGARLEWFPDKSVVLHQTQAYMIANLSREFENATKVDVAGTSLEQGNDAMWGELGAGFTYSMTEQFKLFVEGSYNTSLAHPGDSYIAKGVVGINASF